MLYCAYYAGSYWLQKLNAKINAMKLFFLIFCTDLSEPSRLCLSVAYGGPPSMATVARQIVWEPCMVRLKRPLLPEPDG